MRLFYSLLLVLFVAGCSKDDDSTPSGGTGGNNVNPGAPVLTLVGANPFHLEMLFSFTDPGATAFDAEEGNLTGSIVVYGTVNSNLPGYTELKYVVSDSTGLQDSAFRSVIVYATAPAMTDMYTVLDSLFYNGTINTYTYSQNVFTATQTSVDTLHFNRFADYNGNTGIYALIDSSGVITLPLQTGFNIGTLSEDHQFAGYGYVTATGFVLVYTDKNLSMTPAATVDCLAYFTR